MVCDVSTKVLPPPAPEPLAPLIDAHTHLDACGARDADDVAAILDRAGAVGVQAVVTKWVCASISGASGSGAGGGRTLVLTSHTIW